MFVFFQVPTSTSAGKAGRQVSLRVVVPIVTITGGPRTRHVEKGSKVELICVIKGVPQPPE